ncbi:fibronectin type III domain-containing protein [Paenibacillus plantarum]|nr:fibronectin type III domain-containing protein [Paenibacillus plantarum]
MVLTQRTMKWRWFVYLLILFLIFSGMTFGPRAASASTASFMGTDTTTKGNWVGAYGSEGYVLPYYTTTAMNYRETPPAADVAQLPTYVSAYAKSGSNYWVSGNQADPRGLQSPDGSTRKRFTVYTYGTMSFSFTLSDNETHQFSVYTTDFGSTESIQMGFELRDAGGTVLDSRTVSTINGGKYVTYRVQGSFKLVVTLQAGTQANAQGFFFDAPGPVWPEGGAASATSVSATSATINWPVAIDPDGVTGYRIYKNNALLDTVSGSVYAYNVTGLSPATTYTFAVEPGNGSSFWGRKLAVPVTTAIESDSVAPVWPSGSALTASQETPAGVHLAWNAATDNRAVTQYRIYRDGTQLATVGSGVYAYDVTGLAPETAYTFHVQAGDSAGNWSGDGPSVTAMTMPAPTYYLGQDTVSKGNWIGTYGGDGYILPFFSATSASGKDATTPAHIASLPSYVSAYSLGGSNGYNVVQNPSTDARALLMPDGSIRKMLTVYTYGTLTHSFTLTDNNLHQVSFYTTDFGSQEVNVEKFELLDGSGNVLDAQTVDTINGGKYVSYLVRGSFKLRFTKLAGAQANVEGIFFDTPLAPTVSDLQAMNDGIRQVALSWVSAGTDDTIVLRKKQGDADFARIAKVSAGVHGYADSRLEPGVVYQYGLRNIRQYRYSDIAVRASVTIPAYQATSLTFEDTSLVVDRPNEIVQLRAVLKDSIGAPLVGKPVAFELAGTYVGSHIDPNAGSGVTDENGVVTVEYTPLFAGSYTIKAVFAVNDILLLNASTDTIPLLVHLEDWEQPPVVLRFSDAVVPGTLFTVSGYGMTPSAVEVAIDDYAQLGASPPSAGARTLDIVQTDDQGAFVVSLLPEDMAPGSYAVWIRNEYGWSEAKPLNDPRPQFISEREAFEGQQIKLVGRNFDAREFGGASADTAVRLKSVAGSVYEMPIVELNPFAVTFAIDQAPPQVYWVEVRNSVDGNWVRLGNGQQLTVTEAGDDPLGLGVAWAKNFQWSNVYNVADYGATADDTIDDTASVQSAVDQAHTEGGGVVWFPDGTYRIAKILLPAGVVLLGESQENTVLAYSGTSTGMLIVSSGDGQTAGHAGVARMKLDVFNPSVYPDFFIWLGHSWGAAVTDNALRTASELFVTEVTIDAPLEEQTGRANGVGFIANERTLFVGNSFKGRAATIATGYVNAYSQVRNNIIEYASGATNMLARYVIVENNRLIGHPEQNTDTHGVNVKSDYYVSNNVIQGIGTLDHANNDGEMVLNESPSGTFNYGEVLGASGTELKVATVVPLSVGATVTGNVYSFPHRYGRLAVVIMAGRGIGQVRDVVQVTGNTISVETPWDIVPDRTSKFSFIVPNARGTVYRNTGMDSGGPISLYGNSFDNVVADNMLTNTGGAVTFGFNSLVQHRLNNTYFVRFDNNTIIDALPGAVFGLGLQADNTGYAVMAYGSEFRNNRVVADQNADASGLFIRTVKGNTFDVPVVRNTLIENNQFVDLKTGISLTQAIYGQVLSGNSFVSVTTPIVDAGSLNTVTTGNAYADVRAPYWSAGSNELSVIDVTSTEAQLIWPSATDTSGAAISYRIYVNSLLQDTVSNINTYTFNDLLPGTAYTFRVEAVDVAGNAVRDQLTASTVTLP